MSISPFKTISAAMRSPRMQTADYAIGIILIASCLRSFLIWNHSPAHELLALGLFWLPPALAAFLLYPIYLILPAVFPTASLRSIGSFTSPLIHGSLILVIATLFSLPIHAGVDPAPQQQIFSLWLHPGLLFSTVVFEWVLFGVIILFGFVKRSSKPDQPSNRP